MQHNRSQLPPSFSGRCLIINVENYVDNVAHPMRRGSDVDVRELKSTWQKFGCDVDVVKDPSAKQILETVENFRAQISRAGQKEGANFFSVVCILAHGHRVDNTDQV